MMKMTNKYEKEFEFLIRSLIISRLNLLFHHISSRYSLHQQRYLMYCYFFTSINLDKMGFLLLQHTNPVRFKSTEFDSSTSIDIIEQKTTPLFQRYV